MNKRELTAIERLRRGRGEKAMSESKRKPVQPALLSAQPTHPRAQGWKMEALRTLCLSEGMETRRHH